MSQDRRDFNQLLCFLLATVLLVPKATTAFPRFMMSISIAAITVVSFLIWKLGEGIIAELKSKKKSQKEERHVSKQVETGES